MSAIVVVESGATVLESISGKLLLNHGEPCDFTVVLSNRNRIYGPESDISKVKDDPPPEITIKVKDSDGTWTSPDLIVEDYECDGPTVTIFGNCRLEQLNIDDQFQGQFEDETLAVILAALLTPYGLVASGLVSRDVAEYNLIGNPLNLLGELVYPLQTYKMGSGSNLLFLSSAASGATYTDKNHLKSFKFKRSRRRKNKAIVERLERGGGIVELAADSRSGDDAYATSAFLAIEPSRQFWIEDRVARATANWTAYDENEDPIGLSPLPGNGYRGVTPAHFIRYSINLDPAADSKGPWERSIEWTVWGVPADGVEDPVDGYSATGVAGDGSRPYPSPYSLASVNTEAQAQAAADAISSRGERESEHCSFKLRLTSAVPEPYTEPTVVDFQTGFSGGVEVQTTEIVWSELNPAQDGIQCEGIVAVAS